MTENPTVHVANRFDEHPEEHKFDRFVEAHPGFTHAVDNMLIPGFDAKLDAVLSDLDDEAAADREMLAVFEKRPDAEAPGVSVMALSDADKTFDDHEIVSIARDCILILQRARLDERADLGEAELNPGLENELRDAIGRDVASRRHHLLPCLEIDDARIVKALLVDGKEVVTVRLFLRGELVVRDDATAEVVEGSTDVTTWQEDWTLTRDPRVSETSDEDQQLTLSGQWFLAHRGWVVTEVERLTASGPGTSALLI